MIARLYAALLPIGPIRLTMNQVYWLGRVSSFAIPRAIIGNPSKSLIVPYTWHPWSEAIIPWEWVD